VDKTVFINVGKKIKLLRELKGITQAELGATFNITPQNVANWERGVALPQVRAWWRLSRLLFKSKDHFRILLTNEFNDYVARIIK
jgi:transcriptional regulator with XRE-family HTH domain